MIFTIPSKTNHLTTSWILSSPSPSPTIQDYSLWPLYFLIPQLKKPFSITCSLGNTSQGQWGSAEPSQEAVVGPTGTYHTARHTGELQTHLLISGRRLFPMAQGQE